MTTIPFGQVECGECGMPYCPTRDGRWNHQHIFGHQPTPAKPETKPLVMGTSSRCVQGLHPSCTGWARVEGEKVPCDCHCGHPDAFGRGGNGAAE